MTTPQNPWRRRAILVGGGIAVIGWVAGAPRLSGLWQSRLVFRDLPGLAPFRAVETTGGLSAGTGVLAGLDDGLKPPDARHDARVAQVRADPCTALFGPVMDALLPIAFFSDFNCPNCRVLGAMLEEVHATRPKEIRIIRHELPLLGAASTVASQAVLAADRQGGYAEMHARLIRSRMVTDLNLVIAIAESVGLDGQRLVADMQSPEIADALDTAKAVAAVFGFPGTPATVIGRTVFLGTITAADLSQFVKEELASLPMACARASG